MQDNKRASNIKKFNFLGFGPDGPSLSLISKLEAFGDTPDDRHAWSTLLAAESEREVDAAFDQIFGLVDQARQTGDISECERLVNWLVREEVIAELHVDILLSSLRLTATIRHEIQGWAAAVQAVADELSKRGTEVAEVDALLWGLRK